MKKIKKLTYVLTLLLSCFGFWGVFFPEFTLVKGSFVVLEGESNVSPEEIYQLMFDEDTEIVYRSKLLELLNLERD